MLCKKHDTFLQNIFKKLYNVKKCKQLIRSARLISQNFKTKLI